MLANDGHFEAHEANKVRHKHWKQIRLFEERVKEAIDMYADGINTYYVTCLKIGAAADLLGSDDNMEEQS